MKSRSEILKEARNLLRIEFETRLEANSRRLPGNCQYNHRQLLDVRSVVLGNRNPRYNRIEGTTQTLGLCMLGGEEGSWQGNLCEDPVDAQGCPYYTPKQTHRQVLEELYKDLASDVWLEANMPGLRAFLWVLQEPVRLTWWQRFRLLFVGRNQEPLQRLELPPIEDLDEALDFGEGPDLSASGT